MKKLVSVLLALVMCLSVTTLAWAEDTLPNGVTFGGANTVYWVSGGADGYAETLKAALTAAHQANGNSITIYCKPSETIAKSDPHINVTKDLTIYANNADFGGNDLSIGTYVAPVNSTTTINIYNAKNLVVWGQPVDGRADVWNVNFYDCVNEGSNFLMYRGGEGATAKLNLRMENCHATGYTDSTVHTTADGSITIINCTFTDNCAPINVAHKQAGTMKVKIEGSTFTGCGSTSTTNTLNQYAAPIRLVNNNGSGTLTAEISGTTITGTVGSNGDILIGDGRNGKSSNPVGVSISGTTGEIQVQQPGYYTDNGGKDESKLASATIGEGERASVDGSGKITVTGSNTDPDPVDPTPVEPEQPAHTNRRYPATTTTTAETPAAGTDVTSAKTFDGGVALYVGMALTSTLGMAWVGKKRAQ